MKDCGFIIYLLAVGAIILGFAVSCPAIFAVSVYQYEVSPDRSATQANQIMLERLSGERMQ